MTSDAEHEAIWATIHAIARAVAALATVLEEQAARLLALAEEGQPEAEP